MTRPWIVFVESNTTGTGRMFAAAASALGHTPVVLAADPARYPYLDADRIERVVVDTTDVGRVLESCRRLSRRAPIGGVTSSSEYFVTLTATVARRLRLPGPDPDAIRRSRNKLRQRRRLRTAGIATPRFLAARSVGGAVAAARTLVLPVVIKPVTGTGSSGVVLCTTLDEVAAHAGTLLSRRQNERGLPVPRVILVEEYVAGSEYSVETFNGDIIGITSKHVGPLPHFVEVGHDFPAVLSPQTKALICEHATRALQALDLTWGPTHIELRHGADGVKTIEANPRLAGGFIPELVRLASGRDLIADTLALVTGQDLQPATAGLGYASIRFLVPPTEGTLAAVEGLATAREIDHVVDLCLYRSAGESIHLCGDFRDRVGHVIAAARDAQTACEAAEAARSAVKLVVESAGERDDSWEPRRIPVEFSSR